MYRMLWHKALCLLFLFIATRIHSMGLGEAHLNSWLGQPLDVLIPVFGSTELSIEDVIVRQVYGQGALDKNLSDAVDDTPYRISLSTDSAGKVWVKATSQQSVREPYVSFLLQMTVQGEEGSNNRGYTLLIDPPPEGGDLKLAKNTLGFSPALPDSKPQLNEPLSVGTLPKKSALASSYQVRSGDTLGQIAQAVRPDPMISLQALIRNLHQANLAAFDNRDINRLRPGANLTLPTVSAYAALPRRNAARDVVQTSKPSQRKVVVSTLAKSQALAVQPKAQISKEPIYSYYAVRNGDTLSQIADRIRPSRLIPLRFATQTLLNNNRLIVGPQGNRLGIGDRLQIPTASVFYHDAGLPAPLGKSVTVLKGTVKDVVNVLPKIEPAPAEAKASKLLAISAPLKANIAGSGLTRKGQLVAAGFQTDFLQVKALLNQVNKRLQNLQKNNEDKQIVEMLNQVIDNQNIQLSIIQTLLKNQNLNPGGVLGLTQEGQLTNDKSPVAQPGLLVSDNQRIWLLVTLLLLTLALAAKRLWPWLLRRLAKSMARVSSEQAAKGNTEPLQESDSAVVMPQKAAQKVAQEGDSAIEPIPPGKIELMQVREIGLEETIQPDHSSHQGVMDKQKQQPQAEVELYIELDSDLEEEAETETGLVIDPELVKKSTPGLDSQPVIKLDIEPVSELVVELDIEPPIALDIEPVAEPLVELEMELVIAPVVEPDIEPLIALDIEPVAEPLVELEMELVIEPVVELDIEPVIELEAQFDTGLEAELEAEIEAARDIELDTELDAKLDAELDAELGPDFILDLGPRLKTKTALDEHACNSANVGELETMKQDLKDQELRSKISSRNLKSNQDQPRFTPCAGGFADLTEAIEFNEIVTPEDLEVFISETSTESTPEDDCIWRAEVYLTYGHHTKAQNLLNSELSKDPDSAALKLALLSLYARNSQRSEFEALCDMIPHVDESTKNRIAQWRDLLNVATPLAVL